MGRFMMVMSSTKRCTKCKKDIYKECFSKDSGNKDGLYSWCKFCLRGNNIDLKLDLFKVTAALVSSQEVSRLRMSQFFFTHKFKIFLLSSVKGSILIQMIFAFFSLAIFSKIGFTFSSHSIAIRFPF